MYVDITGITTIVNKKRGRENYIRVAVDRIITPNDI